MSPDGSPGGRRPRRRLNDLSGKEWLVHSKTTVLDVSDPRRLTDVGSALEHGALVSQAPRRDEVKKDHPATFSEKDVARLVRFFTRKDGLVLDPFLGSGSTAVACITEGRRCLGFELYDRWYRQAQTRVRTALADVGPRDEPDVRCCDALGGLAGLEADSVDFVVTSPPYWSILGKRDHKAERERTRNNLATDYGDDPRDLSTIVEYGAFLAAFAEHLAEYYRVLKTSAYAAVIVSDFRHAQRYYLFHADVAARMEAAGFTVQGLIVLIQDHKKLYPYGYPGTFVPNISNQYIVVGRKLESAS